MRTSPTFVASNAALRVHDVAKASGRPFPKFSDDDVLDYMVCEALILKAGKRDKEAAKKAERDEWKSAAHRPGFKPQ